MKKYLLVTSAILVSVLLIFILLVSILFPRKYLDEIGIMSERYSLDGAMVASIINIESGYEEDTTSNRGAIGIIQILPSTAVEIADKLGIEIDDLDALYDVRLNMEIGCYYLRYLLDYFDGNITNSLCAYNWGMGNVRDWIDSGNIADNGDITNIPVAETRNYLHKYRLNYYVYSKLYNLY